VLAGIDVEVGDRWRATMGLGYLGGFDSRIVLTEATFTADKAVQLVGGHVYLQPTAVGSPATSLLRTGGVWLPLRGRVSLDNRLLVERRAVHTAGVSIRVRDRLRASWAIEEDSRLRVFGAVETFAVGETGIVEQRYQAGVVQPAGPVAVETYWLQSRSRSRPTLNVIALTAFWRIGKR
jgi:hypothetical protein